MISNSGANGRAVVIETPPRTLEQASITSGIDGKLSKRFMPQAWYKKVREMRRDPTLGFVRDLYMAPILGAEWTVVSDSPEFQDGVQVVYDALVPRKDKLLRDCLRGLIDYGWQVFERVQDVDDDGHIKIRDFKALLHDITDVLVDEAGTFVGAYNNSATMRAPVELAADECVLIYRDAEGTNWYGEALMYRAEKVYDSWEECEDAARRYDTKIAGAHWVIHYPTGTTLVDGVERDNYLIAKDMLAALESSGKIVVPNKVAAWVTDLNTLDNMKMAWRIELLSAPGSAEASFVGRQRYLDSLKARALGIPERAALEGQFGTRAEAEAHADFAISNIEMGHKGIIDQLNEQVSNPLLEMNCGREFVNKVRLVALPLSDWKRAQMRQLYMSYFNSTAGQERELERLDWDAMREQLSLPVKDEDEILDDDLLDEGGVQIDDFTPTGGGGAPVDDFSPAPETGPAPTFPDETAIEPTGNEELEPAV